MIKERSFYIIHDLLIKLRIVIVGRGERLFLVEDVVVVNIVWFSILSS